MNGSEFSNLKGRNILLGVTGGIAAFKSCQLVSSAIKKGAAVKVILTENATEFVGASSFEALSKNPVYTDIFRGSTPWDINHISLAKWADVMVIAPATANIMAKAAAGIADDLLSTTILAYPGKIFYAPAMNTIMYESHATQDNMKILSNRDASMIEPGEGRLACGDIGRGRMAEPDDILSALDQYFAAKADLAGKTVVVTAGPTREYIDPVRFLSNPSSGRMGYALASECAKRGAVVHLITGPVSLDKPDGCIIHNVTTALDMYDAVMNLFNDCDIAIMAAAVADYRPKNTAKDKIKKSDGISGIELVRNPDILKEAGSKKGKRILTGFAAETNNLIENAKVKLIKKNLDYIFANDVSIDGAGFGSATNEGVLLCRDGREINISNSEKKIVASIIIDCIVDGMK